MRYAIIASPASGKMTVDQKRSALYEAADIFDAEIQGLDAITAYDFVQCARELTAHCDVLVIAGGDGTFSDIINSIDTTRTPIAYLPLGTGNAMRHALEYKGSLSDIAMRIRDGETHEYDLIDCDGKKRAFMASIGIDGTIIRIRDKYIAQGITGFKSYFRAAIKAYFREYKRTVATITIDGAAFETKDLLSLVITKQPYYGFGMNIVPGARFNDRKLHLLCINSGLFMSLMGAATALTIGNRVGKYLTGHRIIVKSEQPLLLQIDGNEAWEADAFNFKVLPNALKLKY